MSYILLFSRCIIALFQSKSILILSLVPSYFTLYVHVYVSLCVTGMLTSLRKEIQREQFVGSTEDVGRGKEGFSLLSDTTLGTDLRGLGLGKQSLPLTFMLFLLYLSHWSLRLRRRLSRICCLLNIPQSMHLAQLCTTMLTTIGFNWRHQSGDMKDPLIFVSDGKFFFMSY